MEKYNQIIIIGGGSSVKEGIDLGLWSKIENKFTIGLNYVYKFFNPSVLIFVDIEAFFRKNFNDIKNLPLLIGRKDNKSIILADNTRKTILLPPSNSYDRSLKKGVYNPELVGFFSLTIATHLLDKGEIFLLGFDMGSCYNLDECIEAEINGEKMYYIPIEKDIGKEILKGKDIRLINGKRYIAVTHWYQDKLNHKGTGKTNYFYINDNIKKFEVYKNIKDLKIYNVSLNSRIPYFPKISYKKFFKMLNKKIYNRDNIRQFIIEKLIKTSGELYGKES